MPEVGSASLAIIPSFKGFQSNLESGTGKAMTAAGVAGGTAFGDSAGRSAGTKFRAHVRSFAKVAAVGLGLATAGAIKFAGDSIAEAREAQKVGKLTNAVLKSTGGVAKVSAKDVDRLSKRLMNKAAIDDEVIQSGANLLLTFRNVRNEQGESNKVFDRGLTAALDLSTALGTDLKSSTLQVGKALNDPVKGVTALTRAGVQFTDQQKDQIKKLTAAGDTLKAQKIILKELETQIGGSAKSQATEADKLSVAWGNFKEEIGTELLPVMDDLARFLHKKGIPAARDFAGWVRDDMIPAVKDGADAIEPLVEGVKDLAGFLNDLPKPAKIAGIAAIVGGIGYSKLRGGNSMGGGGLLGGIGKAVGLAKPVPVFVTNPGFGGDGLPGKPTSKLGKVGAVAGKAAGPVALVAGAAVGLNEFRKWNHGGDKNAVGGALGGGKVGDFMRGLFDSDEVKEYDKSLGVLNNTWAKVRTATEGAREKVVAYDGTVRKLPTTWTTVFNSVNLARDTALIRQYGGMLDGLDGRTVETFIKTTRIKNDIGDSGDPRFGGFRAHGGSMHPGYSYVVGERGPELVTVGARSEVAPNGGTAAGFPSTVILNVDGDQFRAYVDNRINAAGRHPTGRRR